VNGKGFALPRTYISEQEAETRRLARAAREAPRIPWDKFRRDFFHWKMGEHVALIGPTGQGKTTLLRAILPVHPYVAVFATKPKDESIDALINNGYRKVSKWYRLPAKEFPRRVLWPDASTIDAEDKQREVFRHAFGSIYREGNWTVAIDELWYIINILGLGKEVKTYLLQARSLGISLVAATQRPAWVPLEIYDQSTWLFFWRDNDDTNLKRLSGINARSSRLITELVSNLDKYQVLCINTRDGEMVRTHAPYIPEGR
jgi:hypothetical protein